MRKGTSQGSGDFPGIKGVETAKMVTLTLDSFSIW